VSADLSPDVLAALAGDRGLFGTIPASVRDYVLVRDHGTCVRCGWVRGQRGPGGLRLMTIDHIRPRRDGGSNHPDNLRVLCWPCHQLRNKGLWDDDPSTPPAEAIRPDWDADWADVPTYHVDPAKWHGGPS
jgi:5-methylcytosine-specific restriction endonuclease McrA